VQFLPNGQLFLNPIHSPYAHSLQVIKVALITVCEELSVVTVPPVNVGFSFLLSSLKLYQFLRLLSLQIHHKIYFFFYQLHPQTCSTLMVKYRFKITFLMAVAASCGHSQT
jgi:hypothetical protein